MGDVEQTHSVNVLHSDNRILVAVVAAIVLTTSSALIYRTKHLAIPGMPLREHPVLNATLSSLHLADPSIADKQDADTQPSEKVTEENGDNAEKLSPNNSEEVTRDSKSSRSKERRRRGKDPLKEIMKSGKKFKGLPKTSRPNTGDTDGSAGAVSSSGSVVSRTVQLDAPQNSYESSTRSTNENAKMNPQSPTDTPERPVHADVEEPSHPASSFQPLPSVTPEITDFHENNFQADSSNTTHTPDMQSSSADSTSSISTSVLSPNNISSLPSDNPHDTHHIHSSQSLPFFSTPAFGSDNRTTSKPQNPTSQTFHGPWDWDSQLSSNPPPNSDVNYRKPPRFRSKSRIPNSGSASPMPTSKSYSISYNSGASYSPVSNASTSSSPSISLSPIPDTEGSLPSFTFPTLNSPSPSSSPGPSLNIIQHSYMNSSGSVNSGSGHTTRRVPTPSRTPAGSTDSGASLSLSTQTQIASLKGALEAARMREEKFRLEAERYSKECEMLKWKWGEETVAWRHAQAELQAQVVHLMHQLQGYISAFTPPPNSPAHLQVSNTNQPFPSRRLHSPSPRQSPAHLQMHAANSQTRPPRTHSPFFAYQGQNTNQQLSQPNLLALFPGAASSGGPSSASGSSSVESTSPQLDTLSFWDRGRRRTRTIRNGDVDEDWLVTDGHGDLDFRSGTDGASDFSDVLADAILKRPESIRVRARPERQETEFTFPSIASFGSVDRSKETGGKPAGGAESQEDSILPKDTISNRNSPSSREEPRRAG